jgi:hypothetical protein
MDILASEKIELLVVEVLRVLWRSDSHLQFMFIVWMKSLMRSCCLSVVLEEEVTKEVSIIFILDHCWDRGGDTCSSVVLGFLIVIPGEGLDVFPLLNYGADVVLCCVGEVGDGWTLIIEKFLVKIVGGGYGISQYFFKLCVHCDATVMADIEDGVTHVFKNSLHGGHRAKYVPL